MSASREGLNPEFAAKLAVFERKLAESGIHVKMTAGYRSIAGQNALYAQGRTKPGKVVTKARGGYSWHNYGLGADYVFIVDGKAVYEGPWQTFGKIAKACGLEWGGSWIKFKDKPHVQWTHGKTLAQMRALAGIK